MAENGSILLAIDTSNTLSACLLKRRRKTTLYVYLAHWRSIPPLMTSRLAKVCAMPSIDSVAQKYRNLRLTAIAQHLETLLGGSTPIAFSG